MASREKMLERRSRKLRVGSTGDAAGVATIMTISIFGALIYDAVRRMNGTLK